MKRKAEVIELRSKPLTSTKSKTARSKKFPQVTLDKDNHFASIRLATGIEAKSYEKDGFVFSEDAKGNIIEIQILNSR